MAKDKISVIVSCYNEEQSIPLFYEEMSRVATEMNKVDFEFMFVFKNKTFHFY